jgi:diguanylate cyclase (GGDEF)-like protein
MQAGRCPQDRDRQGRLGRRMKARPGVVALMLTAIAVQALGGARQPSDLPLLTTVRQAHGMTQQQAKLGYPVHLRAVVTYYDPPNSERHGALFVKDATGGIYVAAAVSRSLGLQGGTRVVIWGITGSGNFAPIITRPQVRVVRGRRQSLLKAPRVTLPHMLTGADDAQWVEVEGMVHSVERDASDFVLTLATSDGPLTATTPALAGEDYTILIDAKVLIRGVAGPLFNESQEMTGVRLLSPGLAAVTVEEPPPVDPFSLPVHPLDSLLQYSPNLVLRHRVRVRGRVTLHWPRRWVCVQDGKDGLCVETLDQTLLQEGELIDLAGFPALVNYQPTLSDASLRPAGASIPIAAKKITAGEAFAGEVNSELVQIKGLVIGTSLTMEDPALLLSSGGYVVPAILPASSSNVETKLWLRELEGSTVTVKGVFSGKVDRLKTRREGEMRLESLEILLRSPADVTILAKPSWWTGGHTLAVLGLVLLLTVAVLVWVALLRRQVKQQTLLVRQSEERFRHLAEHDTLTGLTSRSLLHDRLTSELEAARRKQTPLALLMMDVDNFKHVNDSLGHAAGDEILCVTANRIRAAVRETDTVARMGGDEFIVLLPGVRGMREAGKVAAQVVASVAAPVRFRGQEVPVSVSVGISSYPDGGDDATSLLQNVDTAMYEAKSLGRNCYRFFTPDMARAGADRLEIAVALKHALGNDEFEVHYQPLVDIRTGDVSGLEALLRWRHEKLGAVAPGDFIPVAEETGLIAAIGEWVLRESCRQVGELEKRLGRNLRLAVNISARQMQQGNLPRAVREALSDFDRDPSNLELEITESILISNSSKTQQTFNQIRTLGVRVAIDDFGTGFSSLSYITQFQIDRLKIDRSFIQNCLIDRNSETVTKVIIAMAHGLDISVVAEGVETAEQYRFLEEAECDLAQGYYLSAPVAAPALEELLFRLQVRVPEL